MASHVPELVLSTLNLLQFCVPKAQLFDPSVPNLPIQTSARE